MKKIETFYAEDGTKFDNSEACLKHEESTSNFRRAIVSKIGEYSRDDLRLGGKYGEAVIDSLPFEAPWMSAYGSCLIKVTDVRRNADGKIEFQIADEDGTPYENGTVWRPSESFYSEWPQ